MSQFIRHERCPQCGSDDNLAIFDDGHHCFTPNCTNSNGVRYDTEKHKDDKTWSMPRISSISMAQRGIPERIVSKYGCGVEYDSDGNPTRFHFPNYKDGSLVGTKYRIVADGNHTWEDKQFRWMGESAGLFGMQAAKPNGTVVIHEGECFHPETEILTPQGWIQVQNWEGQYVAQYKASTEKGLDLGQVEFVDPSSYISREYQGELHTYTNHRRFSLSVTPGHSNVFANEEGVPTKRRAMDGLPGAKHTVIRRASFRGEGLQYSDSELRLIVAVSADAAVEQTTNSQIACDFNLVKERKIARLRGLVDDLKINASFCVHTNRPEYTRVRFNLPKRLGIGRLFPHFWISKLSEHQREVIIKELKHWDGWEDDKGKHCEYTSKYLENATFVQTIATLNGYVANVCPFYSGENSYGTSCYYKVNIHYNAQPTTVGSLIEQRVQHDGYVYCLTVPSGMLLVRYDTCISVSGNCDAMAGSVMLGTQHSHVSITHGATGAVDDVKQCWDWLNQYDAVYLSFDNDDPGKAATKAVAALFPPGKCKTVVHATGYKDANDYLMRDDVSLYQEAVKSAQSPRPQGLINHVDIRRITRQFLFNEENWKGIPTGIKGFDKLCGGLRPGSVISIFGGTGLGKTAFVRQIAFNTLLSNHTVLFIPLEMRVEEVATQLLEMWLKRRILMYEAGKITLTPEEFEEAAEQLYSHLLMVRQIGAMTLDDLSKNIEYAALVENAKLVILDHKDAAVNSGSEDDNNARAIDALMGRVKNLALTYGITIIVVSHISRSAHDRDDIVPDIGRIRGSAGVAQNSDVVFGVTRKRDSNVLEVLTKKGDRFTSGNGGFKLNYNTDTLCYEEIDNEDGKKAYYKKESISSDEEGSEEEGTEECIREEHTSQQSDADLRTAQLPVNDSHELHTRLGLSLPDREDNLRRKQRIPTGYRPEKAADIQRATPREGLEAIIPECEQAYIKGLSKLSDIW